MHRFYVVDGQWSPWGAWSPCTKTCGRGMKTRERACNNPAPAHGGAACVGITIDTQACLVQQCPSLSILCRKVKLQSLTINPCSFEKINLFIFLTLLQPWSVSNTRIFCLNLNICQLLTIDRNKSMENVISLEFL